MTKSTEGDRPRRRFAGTISRIDVSKVAMFELSDAVLNHKITMKNGVK